MHRWRRETGQAGRNIKRIVVAFEAGRDGFWLVRWLRARGDAAGGSRGQGLQLRRRGALPLEHPQRERGLYPHARILITR